MLNYTLKSLSKTGFFISKKNNFLNDNMVSYLFCSRNSVFFVDIIQYIVNLRKILYFFRNGVSFRMRFLVLLEKTLFKEIASSYIKVLFENIKQNFVHSTRTFFHNSKRIRNKDVMLGTKIFFSDRFKILIKDSNVKIYSLFLKRIKKFKKSKFFFNNFLKKKQVSPKFGLKYIANKKRVNSKNLHIKINSKLLKYLNLLIIKVRSANFLIKKYDFIFSKKQKRKVKFLIKNLTFLQNRIRSRKLSYGKIVFDAKILKKLMKGSSGIRDLPFRKQSKGFQRNKNIRKLLNYNYVLKRKIHSRTDYIYKVKELNSFKIFWNQLGLEKLRSNLKIFEDKYLSDFVFFYFLFYKVKKKDQRNEIIKKISTNISNFSFSRSLCYKKLLGIDLNKQISFIKRRFFDVYKRGNFLLFKEKKKIKLLNIRHKFLIKRKLRQYKLYYVKLLKCKRMRLKIISLRVLENFIKMIQKKEKSLKEKLLKISDSIFSLSRKIKVSKVRILHLSNFIMYFNKVFSKTQQNKNVFFKLMNFNNFSNFFYDYKSKFFKRNFYLWSDSWLPGGLSNFNGLKRTYKGKNADFKRLRTLPDFFVLLNSFSKEEVVREIFSLKLPLLGISDVEDNPYFFNYTVLSNTGSQSLLFFYFCLLLEASFRGYILETRKFLS